MRGRSICYTEHSYRKRHSCNSAGCGRENPHTAVIWYSANKLNIYCVCGSLKKHRLGYAPQHFDNVSFLPLMASNNSANVHKMMTCVFGRIYCDIYSVSYLKGCAWPVNKLKKKTQYCWYLFGKIVEGRCTKSRPLNVPVGPILAPSYLFNQSCGALFLLPLWTHLGVRYVSLLQGKVGRAGWLGWDGLCGRGTWFVGLEGDDFHISRPSHIYRQSPLSPYKELHFRRDGESERECAFSNLELHPQGFTCSDAIEQKQ